MIASRRVIIVSYYFPPAGGAGTQRAAKLCKYLARFGWTPSVICHRPKTDGLSTPALDASMAEADLPPELRVEHVSGQTPGEWLRGAGERLQTMSRETPVDAVLITMSPFWLSGLLADALAIAPTVLDLRDPWAFDGVPTYRHWFEWRQDRQRMRAALRQASAVVMNTPEARASVLRSFSELDDSKVYAIPNGFDPDDFAHAERPQEVPDAAFRLVHTGTFLTKQVSRPGNLKEGVRRILRYRPEPIRPRGRSVGPLLAAMEQIRRETPGALHDFRFVHIGALDEATKAWVDRSSVHDMVVTRGYVPHAESVGWLLSADALFLHLHGVRGSHRARIVPGKTYEYLASGRPVLAALPPGDARDLAAARERCVLADPCDPASIARALRELIDRRGAGAIDLNSDEALAGYTRESIAEQMGHVLNQAAGCSNRSPALGQEARL